MKKLKDFEKEISKCSKCGLCQKVCPIFEITSNECAVSKGKFVMLSGVLKGDLELSDKINSYLDQCLKCGKCSNFCPAGINVCEILQTAKYEYLSKRARKPLLTKDFLDGALKISENLTEPFRKTSAGGEAEKEILYFKGCVNKIYPSGENALKSILNKAGVKLLDADFSCCGLPFFSSGNLEEFEKIKEKNTRLINENLSKYILTDCASCESTLKSYGTIEKEFITAEKLILDLNLSFELPKVQKIAFHKPCHAGSADDALTLLKRCKNLELVKIPESCCGLAGEFALKNPKLSAQLGAKRAREIKASGAEIVLTTCPACVIGLKKALLGTKIKVYNLIEFLAKK